jgi:uncharacterized protein YjbI with pentapeptide repeats
MISVAELHKKYESGKKNFENIQLKEANLRGADLRHANFRGADLTGCDLTEACLDGANLDEANLSKVILDGASLVKTSLNNAILNKASLIKTKLIRASLKEANLREAALNQAYLTISYLNQASLNKASLKEALLNGAYLNEADLTDADLTGANLDNTRFKDAYYNKNTLFDSDFDPTKAGMQKILVEGEITAEILVKTFNSLCLLSQHYLGNQMTNRYWQSSRPDVDWLARFKMDSSGRVTFSGIDSESISIENLKWYHQWLNSFIKSCSQILNNFPEMIEKKQLIDPQINLILKKYNQDR